MRKTLVLACLVFAVGAWAQTQVATVTSSSPLNLRGVAVTPGQSVPAWPVLAGDTLMAGDALTIVTFGDGSVLTLEPRSEAKIDLVNGKPVFQLVKGTARYSLKSTAAVQLMEATQTVTPKNMTGVLTLGGNRPGGGFWTTGHTVAVAAGVAGVAAVAGVVGVEQSTSGGAAASPSK